MIIKVTIIPNARAASVEQTGEGAYKVRVNAPAIEGKANKRLIEILAKHFGVSKSHVSILRGLASRNKVVEID